MKLFANIVIICLYTIIGNYSSNAETVFIDQISSTRDTRISEKERQKQSLFSPAMKEAVEKELKRCWGALYYMADLKKSNLPPLVIDAQTDEYGTVQSVAPHLTSPEDMPPVDLVIFLDKKANIISVDISPASRENYDNYPGYRPVVIGAMYELKRCSPLRSLTAFDYDKWKKLPVSFDPS